MKNGFNFEAIKVIPGKTKNITVFCYILKIAEFRDKTSKPIDSIATQSDRDQKRAATKIYTPDFFK